MNRADDASADARADSPVDPVAARLAHSPMDGPGAHLASSLDGPHLLRLAPGALHPLARATQRALMGLVRGYQLFFSPWLGSSCRFEPSCSHYALQALALHGPARGSALAAGRLLRCHPWCAGGLDPVPARRPVRSSLSPDHTP